MDWLARMLERLRHGAAPEERAERIEKAANHEQTIARADALVDSAEETLGRARDVRRRSLRDYEMADQAIRRPRRKAKP